MHAKIAVLASTLTVLANAIPHAGHRHQHAHSKRSSTFPIRVENNCPDAGSYGLWQITSSFDMVQMSEPVSIASGSSDYINAPFTAIGMRLSATSDQGAAAQWNAQALFEFGYSTYDGQDGTAYDLSFIGSDIDESIGLSVVPDDNQCASKKCLTPDNCSITSGWTSASQVDVGSPADTVCYYGTTGFTVVWCPSS